jgi:hypothetical protein
VIVPKPLTSARTAERRFGKQDFIYEADVNEYGCPAGQRRIKRFTLVEHGMTLHNCWSSAFQACALHDQCALRDQCATGKDRRVKRWENEAVLDTMQERLDNACNDAHTSPDRRAPVRDDQGLRGGNAFLKKTLARVSTEMSLHVLVYNLKRMLSLWGIAGLIDAFGCPLSFLWPAW